MSALEPVTIYATAGTHALLVAKVREQVALRDELAGEDRFNPEDPTREEAAAVRTAWAAELATLRDAGELLDSNDRVAAYGIRAEVVARGWDREWAEAKRGEAVYQGRYPGSRSGRYPDEIPVRLPKALADQVRGALWELNREVRTELRRMRDRKRAGDRDFGADLPPAPGYQRRYNELADQVITPGDIWRAGLDRVLRPRSAAEAPEGGELI